MFEKMSPAMAVHDRFEPPQNSKVSAAASFLQLLVFMSMNSKRQQKTHWYNGS
jgi:poly-beta-hydroxyalkanoate depolymerase